MKKICFLLLSVLMLASCHGDKNDKCRKVYGRSVLVYIAGDNNLASFIKDDVGQMMEGSKTIAADDRLLLFVDKKGTLPYILEVNKGDTVRRKTFEQELKTSDAAQLRDAVKWMQDNYTAHSYGLVLWGHATGWKMEEAASRRRAYGQDTTPQKTWMSIPDMAQALEQVTDTMKLSFIFADCCCFQCVETAYELRRCADYIIGSAAEIPGEGAPYQTVIPALFSHSNDYWKLAADAYHEQVCTIDNYNNTSTDYKEPMSVIDTRNIETLAQATRTALQQSLEGSEGYPNVNGLIYYYDYTFFDMNDFMLRTADENVYRLWRQAFDAAVPYRLMTTYWMANHVAFQDPFTQSIFRDFTVTDERYGGVSMYVPQDPATIYYNYRDLITKMNADIKRMQWYSAAGLDKLGW